MRFVITAIVIFFIFAVYFIKYLRQKKAVGRVFSYSAYYRINKSKVRFPRLFKRILLGSSILLLIQSIFIPALDPDKLKKTELNQNADINKTLFLLDVSLSMITTDVAPSRLEMAKIAIGEIIKSNENSTFALVPFAGSAFIQCPFTSDIEIVKQFLEILNHNTIKQGGSDLSAGLRQAIRLFKKSKDQKINKNLVILTDGADFSGEVASLYAEIKSLGVRTFILGIGGNKPVPIMLYKSTQFREALFKKDKNNKIVLTKLDKAKLNEIASGVGGKLLLSIEEVNKQLGSTRNKTNNFDKNSEANIGKSFFMFLMVPVFLLVLGEMITTRSRSRLKWVGRFED